MFLLLVHVEGVSSPFCLRFTSRVNAERVASYKDTQYRDGEPRLWWPDDFGQEVFPGRVLALQIIDLEKDLDVQGEIAMLQARKNAALQREAQSGVIVPSGGLLRRPN